MTEICYLNLKQAREVLAGVGVELTARQIKRAADKDARKRLRVETCLVRERRFIVAPERLPLSHPALKQHLQDHCSMSALHR